MKFSQSVFMQQEVGVPSELGAYQAQCSNGLFTEDKANNAAR